MRWSTRYDQTVAFYRDIIGLPVLETFQDSYGLDGTILGLPGGAVHLEIVRLQDGQHPAPGLDQLVLSCPMLPPRSGSPRGWPPRAWNRWRRLITGRPQIDYWQTNGGVTYQDPAQLRRAAHRSPWCHCGGANAREIPASQLSWPPTQPE